MKLNIAYPTTGSQKQIVVEDEVKLRAFYDKRISHEVDGINLGDEYKGYIFRITGGNDAQGFPMKQGVLSSGRVRLLLGDGHSCFRKRRNGMRKRKSVRGCIIGADLSVINLVVVAKGEGEIPGLTDTPKPNRLGPKRAQKLKKLFNLEKKDDVRQYVIRRTISKEGKKDYTKAARIQRLITPQRLQHKRQAKALKRSWYEKSKKDAEEYASLVAMRHKEAKEARATKIQKRRSESRKMSSKDE